MKKKVPSKFVKQRKTIWRGAVFTLAEKFGWKCWYCAKPLTIHTASLDHIIPRGEGGEDRIDNLALSCLPCNFAKNDLRVEEFIEWLDWVRSGHSYSILREEAQKF